MNVLRILTYIDENMPIPKRILLSWMFNVRGCVLVSPPVSFLVIKDLPGKGGTNIEYGFINLPDKFLTSQLAERSDMWSIQLNSNLKLIT